MTALAKRKKQQIVSHKSFLREFPVDWLMKKTQEFWEKRGYGPHDRMYMEDYFEVFRMLHDLFKEKLVFGDMRYMLQANMDMYSDEVLVDIKIQKANTKMELLAGSSRFSEYNIDFVYNSNAPGGIELQDIIKFQYKLFTRVEEAVSQWNEICVKSKPIITERPPTEDVTLNIYDGLMQLADEEYYHVGEEYADWEHFIADHAFSASMLVYFPFHLDEPSLPFGPFDLWFRLEVLDGELNIITPIIGTEGVMMQFVPVEVAYSSYYEFYTIDDFMVEMDNLMNEILSSVIQWNKLL